MKILLILCQQILIAVYITSKRSVSGNHEYQSKSSVMPTAKTKVKRQSDTQSSSYMPVYLFLWNHAMDQSLMLEFLLMFCWIITKQAVLLKAKPDTGEQNLQTLVNMKYKFPHPRPQWLVKKLETFVIRLI